MGLGASGGGEGGECHQIFEIPGLRKGRLKSLPTSNYQKFGGILNAIQV